MNAAKPTVPSKLTAQARHFARSATGPTDLRLLRRLVWLYFWLLIFEGVFRKWYLPQYSNQLLIVRDPVVLLIYLVAIDKDLFPRGGFMHALVVLATFTTFLALAQYIALQVPFTVLIFGLRSDFLHLPLIFLLPKIFTRQDVDKMGKWILILAIPMVLLMAQQFRSSPDAWINRTVGAGEGRQLSSALGKIRPAGTFSFITGPVLFYALVTSFLGYGLIGKRGAYPIWLMVSSSVALGLAVAVSGSRSTMLAGLIVVTAWFLGSLAAKRVTEGLARLMALGVISFFILGQIDLFKEGTEVFAARWELGTGAEREHGGLLGRIASLTVKPFAMIFDLPALGYGLGVGTNVGARLISGRAQFLLSEGEWGRVLMEMGALLGGIFIVYRVTLTVWLGKLSIRAAKGGDILPVLLYSACAVNIFNGQIAQPTVLGFVALGGGLCLTAIDTSPTAVVEPKSSPGQKKLRPPLAGARPADTPVGEARGP
jgi:hypothetical protein